MGLHHQTEHLQELFPRTESSDENIPKSKAEKSFEEATRREHPDENYSSLREEMSQNMIALENFFQGDSSGFQPNLEVFGPFQKKFFEEQCVPLSQQEKLFLDAFSKQDIMCSHFTRASAEDLKDDNGDFILKPGLDLLEEGKLKILENSSSDEKYGTNGYVFFGISIGDNNQKSESRFGKNMALFKKDDSQFTQESTSGICYLFDRQGGHHYKYEKLKDLISETEFTIIDRLLHDIHYQRNGRQRNYKFDDIKKLMAYSLIIAARACSPENRDKILGKHTKEHLNHLMLRFFRPEVLIPGKVKIQEFKEAKKEEATDKNKEAEKDSGIIKKLMDGLKASFQKIIHLPHTIMNVFSGVQKKCDNLFKRFFPKTHQSRALKKALKSLPQNVQDDDNFKKFISNEDNQKFLIKMHSKISHLRVNKNDKALLCNMYGHVTKHLCDAFQKNDQFTNFMSEDKNKNIFSDMFEEDAQKLFQNFCDIKKQGKKISLLTEQSNIVQSSSERMKALCKSLETHKEFIPFMSDSHNHKLLLGMDQKLIETFSEGIEKNEEVRTIFSSDTDHNVRKLLIKSQIIESWKENFSSKDRFLTEPLKNFIKTESDFLLSLNPEDLNYIFKKILENADNVKIITDNKSNIKSQDENFRIASMQYLFLSKKSSE